MENEKLELEIEVEFEGKKFKSVDYGWNNENFEIVDKETGKLYIFKNAFFSSLNSLVEENDIIKTEDVKFNIKYTL